MRLISVKSATISFAALTTSLIQKRSHALATSSASKMPPLLSERNMSEHMDLAQKAIKYFDSSPDPFHAVQTSIDRLSALGFTELKESEPFQDNIKPGGKYYFSRNKSTIVAFAIGSKYEPGNGFKVIGGHTDSPNLKVKPHSKRSSSGCTQLAVECYGGGLWHTWFDRDLGISGRVFVRNADGRVEQKLVRINRPILRIPNLAIHLVAASEREAFKINKEDHLTPILATEAKKALTGEGDDSEGWKSHQEPLLLEMIANELDVKVDSICDFELNLFDVQTASLGGAYSEFIHSGRLDNLASCFLAVEGLAEHSETELDNDEDISLIALFDHEEVGSSSLTGAGSPIMGEAVRRISAALCDGESQSEDLYATCIQKSFVLSVDQAHAIHPNYASKHEKGHAPKMNAGMVIKRNANQRYATNGVTGFLVKEIADKAGLPPVQEFVVRNDCGCGSTIGPIISSSTGIRAIDMGCPQLSMHSIRETMGVKDLTNGLTLFKAFFKYFRDVDSSLEQ